MTLLLHSDDRRRSRTAPRIQIRPTEVQLAADACLLRRDRPLGRRPPAPSRPIPRYSAARRVSSQSSALARSGTMSRAVTLSATCADTATMSASATLIRSPRSAPRESASLGSPAPPRRSLTRSTTPRDGESVHCRSPSTNSCEQTRAAVERAIRGAPQAQILPVRHTPTPRRARAAPPRRPRPRDLPTDRQPDDANPPRLHRDPRRTRDH